MRPTPSPIEARWITAATRSKGTRPTAQRAPTRSADEISAPPAMTPRNTSAERRPTADRSMPTQRRRPAAVAAAIAACRGMPMSIGPIPTPGRTFRVSMEAS